MLCVSMIFSTTLFFWYFILLTIGNKDLVDKYYLNQIIYDNNHDRNHIVNFTYIDYIINIDIQDVS